MTRARLPKRLDVARLLVTNPRLVFTSTLDRLHEEGYLGGIPVRPISFISASRDHEVKLQCLSSDIQGVTVSELLLIGWLASYYAPMNIFEFGTADGRTTLNLALNSPDACRIYTIDLPDQDRLDFHHTEKASVGEERYPIPYKESVGACFVDHPVSSKITQILGDTASFDFSPFAKSMDLIFIDANHDYEYVRSDTQNALRMRSDRGIVVWHDYQAWEGVRTCVDELYEEGLDVFCVKAMNLACYIPANVLV